MPLWPPNNRYKLRERARARDNAGPATANHFLNHILLVYEIIYSAFLEPIYGKLQSHRDFNSLVISVA